MYLTRDRRSKLAARRAGLRFGKSCRFVKKQLHLFAGYDDYPKAKDASPHSRGGSIAKVSYLGTPAHLAGSARSEGTEWLA
jgi:hypothetical protein